jgi:hypothetical protein
MTTLTFDTGLNDNNGRSEQKINRDAYRSLSHHQIQPQKSPVASIKSRLGIGLNRPDSQQYIIKTIENDRLEQRPTVACQLEASFDCGRDQSTPKNYHMLGTRQQSNRM